MGGWMNVYFNYNKPTRSVHNPHFVVEERRLRNFQDRTCSYKGAPLGFNPKSIQPQGCVGAAGLSSCASLPVLGKMEPQRSRLIKRHDFRRIKGPCSNCVGLGNTAFLVSAPSVGHGFAANLGQRWRLQPRHRAVVSGFLEDVIYSFMGLLRNSSGQLVCVWGERFLKKRMVVFGVTLGKELLQTSGRSCFLSPVIPEVLETTRDSPASRERSVYQQPPLVILKLSLNLDILEWNDISFQLLISLQYYFCNDWSKTFPNLYLL